MVIGLLIIVFCVMFGVLDFIYYNIIKYHHSPVITTAYASLDNGFVLDYIILIINHAPSAIVFVPIAVLFSATFCNTLIILYFFNRQNAQVLFLYFNKITRLITNFKCVKIFML